ncbi:MAG: hypothetical protein QOD26_1981 [Betaproteobacteria bacterium]|nr:hypothetical protein [Betaproteobacteria bacterium]
MRLTGILICLAILSGCGTMDYKPTEYPLRDGLVPPFNVSGAVAVSNAQPADAQVIVYSYMGGSQELASNLKAITQVMVEQTVKELQKNGRSGAGAQKSIALKVNSLVSRYMNALFWRSSIQFQATLGNGEVLDFDVPHTSGNPQQNLNGNIAEGVMMLLRNERVRAYLGS